MTAFDLQQSLKRARRRLGDGPLPSARARRSDRGTSRLSPRVLSCVTKELSGQERPRMRELLARIEACCRKRSLKPPSRATVYKLMATIAGPTYRYEDLPTSVQAALYNLAPGSEVPAHQVAFYCFNYGDRRALSFASGLPWLGIYQALRLPGHRKRSRGLLDAVAQARRI